MYHRYLPSDDGTFHRLRVDTPEEPAPRMPALSPPAQGNPSFDSDELLLVVILLLLLTDDQDEDLVLLVAALAFLML